MICYVYENSCPSPGEPFYGQDANYIINPISYTKLGENGVELPDSAAEWIMVRDNVTGLIWEVKTSIGNGVDYNDPHNADNIYTWYDSNPATNGGNAGTQGNGTDTEGFIKALNDAKYGGYSDWRLPSIKELAYIVNGINNGPYQGLYIDTKYFPNTKAAYYWTSTSGASNPDPAIDVKISVWCVDFYWGRDRPPVNKANSSLYVRAVRGGQSGSLNDNSTAENYTDNGDETVTSITSGLMWQKASSFKTWEEALSYCASLNLGTYTDWRLPNFRELRSLADYSRFYPVINPDVCRVEMWRGNNR